MEKDSEEEDSEKERRQLYAVGAGGQEASDGVCIARALHCMREGKGFLFVGGFAETRPAGAAGGGAAAAAGGGKRRRHL